MGVPDPPGHPLGVPRTPPGRLVVGRVLRPHGLRGELSVEVLSDAAERFSPGVELGAGDPDGQGPLAPVTIQAARLHQGRLLLSLVGVEDRDAADRLRGTWLSIPVSSARPLGSDEFWPHQLVGLAVVDRQGRERGRVADVVPGAAHDLLAVELTPEEPGSMAPGSQGDAPVDQARRVALVPAVAALVTVELEAGRVLVEAVPGLLDPAEG
ncbi:MAG TPA: ribosome maturation factor RimM [Actinomycetes bacterium]|nr:ribosome maturation factor RimM [Actinomycetes bacterium]